METVETIVVGGGQAGLAMSHALRQCCREHLVLERARVAERWRSERWDSLHFQFPNWSIELPGCAYAGGDPDGFSRKDEVVRFIERYATLINAPVRTGVAVTKLSRSLSHGFELATTQGPIRARHVVVATGPYQRPRMSRWQTDVPSDIFQLHARDYRNPSALPDGAVVIVGSGASGCQIADDMLEAGRCVFLSVGRHRRVPRRYRGHDVFWWRREIGELDQTVDSLASQQRPPPPIVTGVHGGYDVDLRQSAARGLQLCGHLVGIVDATMIFADDLEHSLRAGDGAFAAFAAAVDARVAKNGLDVPAAVPEPTNRAAPSSCTSLDLRADKVGAVIWANGYMLDFDWIDIPVFGANGAPLQYRGATSVPGVFFLGLHWLHKFKSSFLYGVGEDAAHIASRIAHPGDGQTMTAFEQASHDGTAP